MNIVEEKLHQFDVVTAHIYNMQNKKRGTELPAFVDCIGFEKAKQAALEISRAGFLGELYKRIVLNEI